MALRMRERIFIDNRSMRDGNLLSAFLRVFCLGEESLVPNISRGIEDLEEILDLGRVTLG